MVYGGAFFLHLPHSYSAKSKKEPPIQKRIKGSKRLLLTN